MEKEPQKTKFNTHFVDPLGDSPETQFRQAKIAASKVMGYCAPAIRALNPIFIDKEYFAPGVKATMGVDKYYRVYVGKQFVTEQVQAAKDVSETSPCLTCGEKEHHPLAYIAGTICHEAWHLIRRHSKRYANMGIQNHRKWNIAADLELNDDLLEIFKDFPKPKICLPVFGVWPERWRNVPANAAAWKLNPKKSQLEAFMAASDKDGLETFIESLTPTDEERLYAYKQVEKHGADIWPLFVDHKLAEEYYMLLPDDPECPVHGPPCPSCGVPHPGAHEDEDKKEDGEKGDEEQDEKESEDEQDGDGAGGKDQDDNHSHGGDAQCTCPWTTEHGSGVGGDKRDHELGPPSGENPGVSEAEGNIISREIAQNICEAKKRGKMPAGMARWADEEIEPAKYDWRSQLAKAVMYGAGRKHGAELRTFRRLGILTGFGNIIYPSKYDPVPDITVVQDTSGSMCQDALNASASEIDGICKAIGATVRFTSVDAAASELQDLENVRDMKLTGGGGTDMRVGIEAAMSDPQKIPSVIIVLTDGFTPWPDHPPNNGRTTLIVCLVGPDTEGLDTVPSWALGIKIEENPQVREAA